MNGLSMEQAMELMSERKVALLGSEEPAEGPRDSVRLLAIGLDVDADDVEQAAVAMKEAIFGMILSGLPADAAICGTIIDAILTGYLLARAPEGV